MKAKNSKRIARRIATAVLTMFAVSAMMFAGLAVSADDTPVFFFWSAETGDYVSINIDGSFDDWYDKPKTEIAYDWDKEQNLQHDGSVFVDDENIYIYVKMSDNSYTGFNGHNWNVTVNGVKSSIVVVPPDDITTNPDGITDLVVRDQNGYGIISGSAGDLVKIPGVGDTAEIKIPKSFFTDNPDEIQSVEFYSPNLGPQKVTSVSSPTGAVLIALSGLLIACYGYYRKKDKAGSLKRLSGVHV